MWWNKGKALLWGDAVLIQTVTDNSVQYTKLGQLCDKMQRCGVIVILIENISFDIGS